MVIAWQERGRQTCPNKQTSPERKCSGWRTFSGTEVFKKIELWENSVWLIRLSLICIADSSCDRIETEQEKGRVQERKRMPWLKSIANLSYDRIETDHFNFILGGLETYIWISEIQICVKSEKLYRTMGGLIPPVSSNFCKTKIFLYQSCILCHFQQSCTVWMFPAIPSSRVKIITEEGMPVGIKTCMNDKCWKCWEVSRRGPIHVHERGLLIESLCDIVMRAFSTYLLWASACARRRQFQSTSPWPCT